MTKLVELQSVSYGYGQGLVISEVNLTIGPKDFIGMIGPNGGGKSTIIKLILKLLNPWTGTVMQAEGIKIGYLPQVHQFDPRFPITAGEVVASGLSGSRHLRMKIGKKEREKTHQVLDRIGMADLYDRPIGALSGGQMQRVFIGRALISDPDLLILDEPITYVDNRFELELHHLMEEINQERAILLVSHDVGHIVSSVKTIACVNGTLHYHPSNKISNEILASYNCPIELISHGKVPHRILKTHDHDR